MIGSERNVFSKDQAVVKGFVLLQFEIFDAIIGSILIKKLFNLLQIGFESIDSVPLSATSSSIEWIFFLIFWEQFSIAVIQCFLCLATRT